MSTPELDLLVIGDVNPDIVVTGADPAFGQHERLADSIELVVGGSAGILACAAARLGLRVAIVGVVGDDALGRFMLGELRGRGVDVGACRVDRRRPTGASVLLTRGIDRAILTAPGTIGDVTADDVPEALLGGARHVHVASWFLLTGLRMGLPRLAARARGAGATVSVDPNWDPAEGWDGGLLDLLPQLDLFLPNEGEATRIAGNADVRAAAWELAASPGRAGGGGGGPLVVVKRGPAGALAAAADGTVTEVPGFPVTAIDATGAGDAFDAGFIAARLEDRSVRESLAFAAVCGALSTRGIGGTASQATREEVEAALGGWRSG